MTNEGEDEDADWRRRRVEQQREAVKTMAEARRTAPGWPARVSLPWVYEGRIDVRPHGRGSRLLNHEDGTSTIDDVLPEGIRRVRITVEALDYPETDAEINERFAAERAVLDEWIPRSSVERELQELREMRALRHPRDAGGSPRPTG